MVTKLFLFLISHLYNKLRVLKKLKEKPLFSLFSYHKHYYCKLICTNMKYERLGVKTVLFPFLFQV